MVLNRLYKHTQMEETFGVIMLALVDGEPMVLNLKEMLEAYLNHQREVVVRRTRFLLQKAEDRAHILEGLRIALAHIDEIIELDQGRPKRHRGQGGVDGALQPQRAPGGSYFRHAAEAAHGPGAGEDRGGIPVPVERYRLLPGSAG